MIKYGEDLSEILEFIESARADLSYGPDGPTDRKLFLAVEKLTKICKMLVDNIAYERARNE